MCEHLDKSAVTYLQRLGLEQIVIIGGSFDSIVLSEQADTMTLSRQYYKDSCLRYSIYTLLSEAN